MKTIKKLLVLFLAIVLSVTLTACNNNNEPLPPDEIKLPTTQKTKEKDETIYTILDWDGKIASMKAVNHICDVDNHYYLDYGYFNDSGNNNLSFSAPILIDDEFAKIPALKALDHFYYELNLDQEYYQSRLPFNLNVSYKLNNNPIPASLLANKSGEVTIIIDVEPNEAASLYFKNEYMAQIQVPININHNKILDTTGSQAKVLVGSVVNIAYMVMPNASAHYELKIETDDFTFEGIQATFQPFNFNSLLDNFNIDLSKLDINQIESLIPMISYIQNEGFKPIINSTQPLFGNLSEFIAQLSILVSDENITNQLQGVEDLNQLKALFNAPLGLINQELGNYEEVFGQISNLYKSLDVSLEQMNLSVNLLKFYLEELAVKLPAVNDAIEVFTNNYQYLIEANNKLTNLKDLFERLQPLFEHQDLIELVKNIDEYSHTLEQIKVVKHGIENDLANLVMVMSVFPGQISPIIEDIMILFYHFNQFSNAIQPFKSAVSAYGNFIKTNQLSYFNLDLESQTLIGTCLAVIYGDGMENIGLIDKLTLIQNQITNDLIVYDEPIIALEALITVDINTGIRPIDQIPLSFVTLSNSLYVSNNETYISFYSGIDLIIGNIENLYKIKGLMMRETLNPISFLSDKNKVPNSVQFIIKQIPMA